MNKIFIAILCCFVLCFGLVLGRELGAGTPEESRLCYQPLPDVVGVQNTLPHTEVLPPENILPQTNNAPGQAQQTGHAHAFPKGILPGDLVQSLLVPVVDPDPPNEELQKYVHSQVHVSGNTVRITAVEEDGHYLSAQVKSSIAFLYCDFTFRVNTVRGAGLFPAIWMLPASGAQLPEVDIYEALGSYPDRVYGVMHYLESGVHQRRHFVHKSAADSHTVRLHWTADQISWYVDGVLQQSVTDYVPQEPMYLLINLAVGGDWPGAPTADAVFPAVFETEVLEFLPENIYIR